MNIRNIFNNAVVGREEIGGQTQVGAHRHAFGSAVENGVEYDVIVNFDYGSGIYFNLYDPDTYTPGMIMADQDVLIGSCKFRKDKCIVTVDHERSKIYDDVDEFTLYRVE